MSGRDLILLIGGAVLAAATLGCTKGTAGFDLLDADSIPQPLFSGATIKAISTTSDSTTYLISGECDRKIRSIKARAVGVSASAGDLDGIAVSAPTVGCGSDGKFSFELKSLADLGYAAAEGGTYEVQLRGSTSAGLSNPSSIKITYVNANGGGRKRVTVNAGGGRRLASSASFKAEIRADFRGNDSRDVQTSPGFKLKTGPAVR
jgi:hypothetical protein